MRGLRVYMIVLMRTSGSCCCCIACGSPLEFLIFVWQRLVAASDRKISLLNCLFCEAPHSLAYSNSTESAGLNGVAPEK